MHTYSLPPPQECNALPEGWQTNSFPGYTNCVPAPLEELLANDAHLSPLCASVSFMIDNYLSRRRMEMITKNIGWRVSLGFRET